MSKRMSKLFTAKVTRKDTTSDMQKSIKEAENQMAIENLKIKVLMPEDNDNYFSNIIGNEKNVKYFTQLIKLLKGENQLDFGCLKFMLIGEEGIGKCLMAYSFAKEMEVPIVVIDIERLVACPASLAFKEIKKHLDDLGTCTVLFKNLQYMSVLEDRYNISFCNSILNLTNEYPDCYYFVTSPEGTEIFPSFIENGAFDTNIIFELPGPKEREELIKKFISKLSIKVDPKLDIKKISKDFFGLSAGDIFDILKKSERKALIDEKDTLDYITINETYYAENYGSSTKKMNDEELKMTAYHEAGHVVAGYFADPKNFKVSKVEIACRDVSLGLTDMEENEEKFGFTREELKARVISNFGGYAAEKIMFGTTTSGVIQDLANATNAVKVYVKQLGMNEDFGPIYLDPQVLDSAILDDQADVIIQNMLKELMAKTQLILTEHKKVLIKLSQALIEKEVLYKEEVHKILKGR